MFLKLILYITLKVWLILQIVLLKDMTLSSLALFKAQLNSLLVLIYFEIAFITNQVFCSPLIKMRVELTQSSFKIKLRLNFAVNLTKDHL